MIRPWLEVSVVRRLPWTSVRIEFLRLATCGSCSSDGRSEATAIIIPKIVEITASAASGTRIARSRSFLILVLRLGGLRSVPAAPGGRSGRSEEHTSELQSRVDISYA